MLQLVKNALFEKTISSLQTLNLTFYALYHIF